MSTVLVDASTAAKLSEPNAKVEVRTEDGKLIGVFTPRREATPEDYERAMREVTTEEIEKSLQSGPGRPFAEVIAELRRKYGTGSTRSYRHGWPTFSLPTFGYERPNVQR